MTAIKTVILTPEAGNRLVWREAAHALEGLGHTVISRATENLSPRDLARMFALPPERSGLPEYPGLFFSINFHGLDKFGENFAVLRDKGVPAAVWCVDNPWNLLSGLRTDFWKELYLFVTDPSFIPGLEAHGARRVSFLPLATEPAVFSRPGPIPEGNDTGSPVVFVGRSAFPDKERFFVGQSVPDASMAEALARLRAGERTDFSWWLHKLHLETAATPLWPGSAARKASLGAEESSLAWRAACLRKAASLGLTICGDDGWAGQFSEGDGHPSSPQYRPPLDYYTHLAAVYANASFSLNMMSFLLPGGLNQRHFDVWAAGGFCLTDACRGLGLFPKELTEPVMFATPEDIPERVAYYGKNPEEKTRIAADWKKHILAEHTYNIRMRAMIELIFS